MWHKETRKLCGIYEGDNYIVNVIEAHPRLPLVAVSGIDDTIKVRNIILRQFVQIVN